MAYEPSPWRGLTWRTVEPVELAAGCVHAAGTADLQVRNTERLAALGDLAAQQAHVGQLIAAALADVLTGMEPDAEALHRERADIASVTLVAANRKLSGVGVMMLDLALNTLTLTLSPPFVPSSPLSLGERGRG